MSKNADLAKHLASNLAFFMQRPGSNYRNPNALGVAAKISPNTVRNLLNPKHRKSENKKGNGFPLVDKIALIADKLECEVWELFHPNIQRAMRERLMYEQIEKDFSALPPNGAEHHQVREPVK